MAGEHSFAMPGQVTVFAVVTMVSVVLLNQPCAAQSLLKESENSFNHRGALSKCGGINCSMEPMRSICGTDGRTYRSRCELLRATCEGHVVQVKHKGKCQEKFRCWVERTHAQEVALGQMTNLFVPQCNEDGSYTEVQCHAATGYCWCATKSGQPVPGSSVQNRRPKCNGARPANFNTKRGNVGRQQPKQNKGCKGTDREIFNKNLVELFVAEYNRVPSYSRNGLSVTADPIFDTPEKRAVDWKFSELDKNGNKYLERKEIKSFRRMMKKIVSLRTCAKRFSFFCDQDKNRKISQREWIYCLDVGMNREGTEISSQGGHQMATSRKDESPPATHRKKETTALQVDDDTTKVAEEDPVDCFAERQTQQDLEKNSKHSVYIAECSPDGKYAQVQCFRNTGYCWCVDHETGKPIAGTSVLNMKPDCEKLIKADRPIKGCPDKNKRKFAADFIDFLHKEMIAALNQSSPTPSSNQEQNLVDSIALWKFENLDINDNRVLDRKEWRTFRKELKKQKSIRKCGRNFVKFCDDNNDKKITNDEWLECFSVLKERKNNIPKRTKMGENPLDKYLKND